MATDRMIAIDIISFARPVNDPALFNSATRYAYMRGFEDMRLQALNAVNPKLTRSELTPEDFSWEDEVQNGQYEVDRLRAGRKYPHHNDEN